ncbi:MAG: hypothetical protein ABH874_04035 [Methanobacteriota archaeon]
MRKKQELDLLVDIVKLLKKYGPEPFELLAESISSPEMRQRLPLILTEVAKIARTIPKTTRETRPKQGQSIPRALITLEGVDLGKYQLLMNFYTDLVAKTVLPSLRDINEFARRLGLQEVRAKSRQKAISPLITSLIKFSTEELRVQIQSLKKYEIGDRSLEGWSNIILNRQQ